MMPMPNTRRYRFAGEPGQPHWAPFALGACGFLAVAAFCLFIVAQLGS